VILHWSCIWSRKGFLGKLLKLDKRRIRRKKAKMMEKSNRIRIMSRRKKSM
jgi:hypothetical protein